MRTASIFALILLFIATVSAQEWERIGWRGGSIQIQAQQVNVLYGKAGTGFYRSTDWGYTWILDRRGLPNKKSLYENSLFEHSGKVIVGDRSSYAGILSPLRNGIYYASDAGWSEQQFQGVDDWPLAFDLWSMHYFSSDSIAVLHNAGDYSNTIADISKNGVYFSSNGGNTWSRRMNDLPTSQSLTIIYRELVKQGNRLLLNVLDYDTVEPYLAIAKVYKSDNFGQSWEEISKPVNDTIWGMLKSINDSLMILDAYDAGYYFSIDNGDTWFSPPSPLPIVGKESPSLIYPNLKRRNKNQVLSFRGGNSSSNELYKSEDNGLSWNRIYAYDSNLYVSGLFGNDSVYIITTSREAVRTDPTFTEAIVLQNRTLALNGDAFLLHVDADQLFTISNWDDTITIWSNDGDTLKKVFFQDSIIFQRVKWLQLGNKYYAVMKDLRTSSALFYASSDKGLTWQYLSKVPTSSKFDSLIFTGSVFIVSCGCPDSNFFSSDGTSWTIIPKADLRGEISIAANDSLLIFSESGVGNKESYYTTNFGQTWREIYSSEYTTTRISSAGARIFLSTEIEYSFGKYSYPFHFSDDTGSTWHKITMRTDRLLQPYAFENGILYAVSTGFKPGSRSPDNYQLYASLDTGITWQQLGDSVIDASRFFIGSDYFFLAGDHELWRLPKSTLLLKVGNNYSTSAFRLTMTPNPVGYNAAIQFDLSHGGFTDLTVFDLLGRKQGSIILGFEEAGSYTVQWNTEDIQAGTYMLRLVTPDGSETKLIQVTK